MLILDPQGQERWRIEGYLPKEEFRAQLEMGLARLDVMNKQWASAEQKFAHIVDKYPNSKIAPEALYWRDVSKYSQSHDGAALQSVAKELKQRYPDSEWALRATVWTKPEARPEAQQAEARQNP